MATRTSRTLLRSKGFPKTGWFGQSEANQRAEQWRLLSFSGRLQHPPPSLDNAAHRDLPLTHAQPCPHASVEQGGTILCLSSTQGGSP
jgi:hypothetical protein